MPTSEATGLALNVPAETLEDLYEHAPVGYLTALDDGTTVRANETLARIVGWPVATLVGRDWRSRLLTRAGRTLLETHIKPLLVLTGHAREISLDLRGPGEQRIPVLMYIDSRGGKEGVPLHHRLTIVEASDRRDYERRLLQAKHDAEDASESLRELTADLEQRVDERTYELEIAMGELETFSFAVSHDLRAPLRGMMGLLDLLQEEFGGRLGEEGLRQLGGIRRSGLRMGALIDGLLQLAQGSRVEMQQERVDLSDIARHILTQLALEQPDRRVLWDVEPDLVVQADHRLMDSVLRNLLGNAWKYSGARSEGCIRVFAERIGERRYICVSDNGIGFTPEEAARLFKPFQRLSGATPFPGTGIGLSTVQRIIQRHRGTIEAIGRPGEGATFRFWIPG